MRRENTEQESVWFHSDVIEIYGAPRNLADLRADGELISRKAMATTMRQLGLVGHQSETLAHNHGQPGRGRLPGRRSQTRLGCRGAEPALGRRYYRPENLGRGLH